LKLDALCTGLDAWPEKLSNIQGQTGLAFIFLKFEACFLIKGKRK
jgi:hypothetical protein